MLPRRTSAWLCALTATVAIAGCGGSSSGVTPTAYVTAICKAVVPFETHVLTREQALNPTAIRSPIQGKTALSGFLDGVSADTARTLSQLRAAGTPDVSNGRKIQGAIIVAFSRLEQAMRAGATSARALPTSSASAFQSAATQLGTTVRTSLAGVGSSLAGLRSAKLEAAARKSAACKSLSSG